MIDYFLDFEQEVVLLEGKIKELRHLSDGKGVNIVEEISKLQFKANAILKEKYSNLTPWQRVQVARHPNRPHCVDYVDKIIDNFIPLLGDRFYGEDPAMMGGIGNFRGNSVIVIGQEKGSDTDSRIKRNFGMASPEGYRKAARLMKLADKFNLPVLTFIDTAGAYPGIGAEERGQAEAIACSIETCLSVNIPLISTIIGEGGSGGAIAIGAADRVLMLENSIYSVISPEGCASILWRSEKYAEAASNALNLTANDLERVKVIDKIIVEPLGGAHRDSETIIDSVASVIEETLNELKEYSNENLLKNRRKRYLEYGSNLNI